jgi:hypothetical protein
MAAGAEAPRGDGNGQVKASEHTAWRIAFDNADRLESVRIYADGSAWVELEGNDEPPPFGPSEELLVAMPPKFAEMNAELVAAGWPAMSEWWEKQLARMYTANLIAREKLFHPETQRPACVWRVGRQGGKSTTIARVALYECLYGEHEIPVGTTGIYAIISAERWQAKERVTTIKQMCDVLHVDAKQYTESVELLGIRRAIRCHTASLQGVVSMTCIGAMCDEEAVWGQDEGVNPAVEVIRSLKPSTVTQQNAIIHHVSSPWSTLDEHHRMYERGLQPDQMVFYAPTWVANPTVTEERTHQLEPDEPSWLRAYKAVPLASDETKFFNATLIDQARGIAASHQEAP